MTAACVNDHKHIIQVPVLHSIVEKSLSFITPIDWIFSSKCTIARSFFLKSARVKRPFGPINITRVQLNENQSRKFSLSWPYELNNPDKRYGRKQESDLQQMLISKSETKVKKI